MGGELTLPEIEFAKEASVLIAEKMWRALAPLSDGSEIYDIGQSNFEEGCSALRDVGVYGKGSFNNGHEVLVPVDRVREHVESLESISKATFDELLSAFIVNFIDYGDLSGTRGAFAPPDDLLTAMKLLEHCGYAASAFDGYRWLEKISPVMRNWYIWDDDDECDAEKRQLALRSQAEELAASMPWVVRQRILSKMRTDSVIDGVAEMYKYWSGTEWHYFPRADWAFSNRSRDGHVDLQVMRAVGQIIIGKRI